jgi:hypothetical protein
VVRCSDERTGLSFTIAAGTRQLSHSRFRVPWDWRPYFTVRDSTLPFSSPPTTTRKAIVKVFNPASTLDKLVLSHGPCAENTALTILLGAGRIKNTASSSVLCWTVFTVLLPMKGPHKPLFFFFHAYIT